MIQQKSSNAKKYPNKWETTVGRAIENEDAITGAIRELDEELGIKANKKDLRFIGSYAQINNFVIGDWDIYGKMFLSELYTKNQNCISKKY